MSKMKPEEFTAEEIELADISKALSHPARIKILKILAEKNICMCGDIVNLLPLAQATVSQHLKELKRVGLVQGEIEGPKVCYCVDQDMLLNAFIKIQKLFKHFEGDLSCKTKKK
ncbi:MAG: metalloregulator ArsR/SmtB family transcription factor [Ignavibacteriales bacterium]|nr:metalloregulator ArsR/SmtB family transcription factor [Ignavibacteriales bacterium]